MKKTIVLLLALFTIETIYSKGNQSLLIDIGSLDPNSVFSSNDNRVYNLIVLKNVIKGESYSIYVNTVRGSLPVLSLGGIGGLSETKPVSKDCSTLNEVIELLKNFQNHKNTSENRDEKKLAALVKKVEGELSKKSCDSLREVAEEEINNTYRYYPQEIKAEPGEKVTITIKRGSLTWTYILKGESLGKWVTSYGFGFTSASLGSNIYYAKQIPGTSSYQILKSKNNNSSLDLNYIPAVFFSYFPSQDLNKCWIHSLTAGLGFDLSAPVVFLGYNGMFWQNLGFSLGMVFQQQYKLKDKYSENDIISYIPDKEQLPAKEDLHDKVYRPGLFIAINFRFGENPFKNAN